MSMTSSPDTSAPRRHLLAALAVGALLAGCASKRPAPAARGRVAPGGSVARRAPSQPVPPSQTPLALHPAGREASVAQAMLLVNTPYRYGGNTPEGGFDCSGLVHSVYGQVAAGAARLPRSTAQWAAATTPVSEAALQRGDLVFFNTHGLEQTLVMLKQIGRASCRERV